MSADADEAKMVGEADSVDAASQPARVVLAVGTKGSGIAAHCAMLARTHGIATLSSDALARLAAEVSHAAAAAAAEATASDGGETESKDGAAEGAGPADEEAEAPLVQNLRKVSQLRGPVVLLQVSADAAPALAKWLQAEGAQGLVTGCMHFADAMKPCIDAECRAYMAANDAEEVDAEVLESMDAVHMAYLRATKPLLQVCKDLELLHTVDAGAARAANDRDLAARAAATAAAEATAAAAAPGSDEDDDDDDDDDDDSSRPGTAASSKSNPRSDAIAAAQEAAAAAAELMAKPLSGNVALGAALQRVLQPRVFEVPNGGLDARVAAVVLRDFEGDSVVLHPQDAAPSSHGRGRAGFAGGAASYEGDFHRNALTGTGAYTWTEEGTVYNGALAGNDINGRGRFTWADGSSCVAGGRVGGGDGGFAAAVTVVVTHTHTHTHARAHTKLKRAHAHTHHTYAHAHACTHTRHTHAPTHARTHPTQHTWNRARSRTHATRAHLSRKVRGASAGGSAARARHFHGGQLLVRGRLGGRPPRGPRRVLLQRRAHVLLRRRVGRWEAPRQGPHAVRTTVAITACVRVGGVHACVCCSRVLGFFSVFDLNGVRWMGGWVAVVARSCFPMMDHPTPATQVRLRQHVRRRLVQRPEARPRRDGVGGGGLRVQRRVGRWPPQRLRCHDLARDGRHGVPAAYRAARVVVVVGGGGGGGSGEQPPHREQDRAPAAQPVR
jgi:hypothetical protein